MNRERVWKVFAGLFLVGWGGTHLAGWAARKQRDEWAELYMNAQKEMVSKALPAHCIKVGSMIVCGTLEQPIACAKVITADGTVGSVSYSPNVKGCEASP